MSRLTLHQQLWLRLVSTPGLGRRSIANLYFHYGDVERLFSLRESEMEALEPRLKAALSQIPQLTESQQGRIEDWLQDTDHSVLTLDSEAYPPQLKEIPDPPPLLYVWGDPQVLRQAQIAMVGSRNASQQGLRLARDFARQLSNNGWVPTSGLALGVDACAHSGALEGLGLTVAVLGTGLDQIYPRRHQTLAQDIVVAGGAIISEFPLGMTARAENFPRRNRIISGLSMATLVVEATLKSGSLITARLALEQGRDVFAIPGSVHNPMAKGCHALIRQGAKLVETVEHIYEELLPQLELGAEDSTRQAEIDLAALSESQCALVVAIQRQYGKVDELVAETNLPASEVMAELLALEIEGVIEQVAGNYQVTA